MLLLKFQRIFEIIFFRNFLQLDFSRDPGAGIGPAPETDTPKHPYFGLHEKKFHAAIIRII